MNKDQSLGEDVERAVLAGRPVGTTGPWRIRIGDSNLNFRSVEVDDAVVTGAQVLTLAGVRDRVEHVVFRMLASGLLEEINPEETTDIRSGGVARFLVFKSDRSFRLRLDDRMLDWAASHISGATLAALAGNSASGLEVWQEMRDQSDRLVYADDLVDLAAADVERFYLQSCSFEIFVNGTPETVTSATLNFWQVAVLGFPGATPDGTIVYTIDYAAGPSQNIEGALVDGQTVRVKDGMKFYVTPTDKS